MPLNLAHQTFSNNEYYMAASFTPTDWSDSYAGLRAFVVVRVRQAADDVVHLVLERAIVKASKTDVENVSAWL